MFFILLIIVICTVSTSVETGPAFHMEDIDMKGLLVRGEREAGYLREHKKTNKPVQTRYLGIHIEC